MIPLPSFLRRFLSKKRLKRRKKETRRRMARQMSDAAYAARLERYRRVLEQDVIRVVFQISNISKWKCQKLLELMREHPRFRASVWAVPEPYTSEEQQRRNLERTETFFRERGIPCMRHARVTDFDAETAPDILFPTEPYMPYFAADFNEGVEELLLCYVPYFINNSSQEYTHNEILHNIALYFFCENEPIGRFVSARMDNGGRNVAVVGLTMGDRFLEPPAPDTPSAWRETGKPMKKLIWAPHYSFDYPGNGTFLNTGKVMLDMAKKYADRIQFAFKPHPSLYQALCLRSDWGQERTDAHYEAWRTLPNCQIEEGQYIDLFRQSDACIHDCGSFIYEYLYMDKPCMYLVNDGKLVGCYNDNGLDAISCYDKGGTREEIEHFIETRVLGGQDDRGDARRAFINAHMLPPHGTSAAQNIIDTILSGAALHPVPNRSVTPCSPSRNITQNSATTFPAMKLCSHRNCAEKPFTSAVRQASSAPISSTC